MSKILLASLMLLFPLSLFAQAGTDIFSFMTFILTVINALEWLFWALAIALFFWGLVKFIMNAADTSDHEDGKQLMIWGVICFFVLATLWALVQFLIVSFDITPVSTLPFVDKDGTTVSGAWV
jgi:hypothetical protein